MTRPRKDGQPRLVTYVRLDPEIKKALERIAVKEQRTVSWLINDVMTKWFTKAVR